MTRILALLLLSFAAPAFAAGKSAAPTNEVAQKGFFSVSGSYGMSGQRLLNTDGSMSDFKTNQYGLDLDILLWNAGTGDIRFFGNHENATGKSTVDTTKISTSESVAGLKVFAGNHLYLSGGWGRGQTKLTSSTTDLKLSYEMVRAALGIEFAVSSSVFIGLEFAYKDAAIRKDRNEGISQNTFIEGFGGSFRIIWAPPSITINNYSKR